jgi:ketosteroid isomerase-like protein
MKPPTPKEVINRWFEQVWNRRDKSAIVAMMAGDAVAHLAGGAQACGIAQFSHFQDIFLAAFPDLSVRTLRAVGDETQACPHWEASGTHKGDFGRNRDNQSKRQLQWHEPCYRSRRQNHRGMGLLELWSSDDHAFFSNCLKD